MRFLASLFKGRLNRRNFFVGWLVVGPSIHYITFIWGSHLPKIESGYAPFFLARIPHFILMMFVDFCAASLSVRRLHDTGRKGWWALLLIIPTLITFWGVLLYLLLWKGKSDENKYGKPPEPKINVKGLLGFS